MRSAAFFGGAKGWGCDDVVMLGCERLVVMFVSARYVHDEVLFKRDSARHLRLHPRESSRVFGVL